METNDREAALAQSTDRVINEGLGRRSPNNNRLRILKTQILQVVNDSRQDLVHTTFAETCIDVCVMSSVS
jgi:hypothetical protein